MQLQSGSTFFVLFEEWCGERFVEHSVDTLLAWSRDRVELSTAVLLLCVDQDVDGVRVHAAVVHRWAYFYLRRGYKSPHAYIVLLTPDMSSSSSPWRASSLDLSPKASS